MVSFIDLTGKKFGKWTVLYRDTNKGEDGKRIYWVCQCSCKNKTIRSVRSDSLTSNKSVSCGCVQKEISHKNMLDNQYAKKYNTYDLSGDYGIGHTLKGETFYFDLEDYDKIKDYCWRIDPKGYVVCRCVINDKETTAYMQKIIFNATFSYTEKQIDHINHNKSDNRKCNLRICEPSQNCMNKGVRKDNTTGVTGVYWYKPRNQWVVKICAKKHDIHVGYFDNFDDAVAARKAAEEKYFGEYSYDNSMKFNNDIREMAGYND